ncbi:MAG: 30S ribosomal protein S11 [Kordiimonadales bacterium]|nr:MAG: 30S ribosomal protein S11 [Kordiimonadales bacterium]
MKNKNIKRLICNLYIHCSKNNTRLTLTNILNGAVILTKTAGMLKKGATKRSPLTAYELTINVIKEIKSLKIRQINNLFLKGRGPGRFQTLKVLRKSRLKIFKIKKISGFPFNGCRPKKARRLKYINS